MRGGNAADALIDGSQLLQPYTINGFDSFMQINSVFDGAMSFKGYPSQNRTGNAFRTTLALAMSESCSDKNGAWRFMRGILTPEFQDESGRGFRAGLPTNQAIFDKFAASAMVEETESNIMALSINGGVIENGGIDLDDDGTPDIYPKGAIRSANFTSAKYYYAMTAAEYERYLGFINSITRLAENDDKILEIISDDLALFFNDQKTAAATADVIQGRVSTYINEQR